MGAKKIKKIPYEQLSDLEKLQKQWHKLTGLHSREEWSSAVVRVATASEIAANFAIRREFNKNSNFKTDFVDSMLVWSNGLDGKVNRLLLPLTAGEKEKHKEIKALKSKVTEINSKRNAVVHRGKFCTETEAQNTIDLARDFITRLISLYEPRWKLKDRKR